MRREDSTDQGQHVLAEFRERGDGPSTLELRVLLTERQTNKQTYIQKLLKKNLHHECVTRQYCNVCTAIMYYLVPIFRV
jgi:hypothetical protein